MTVYLDANATECLRPSAMTAMLDALRCEGNPSSVHGPGRKARALLEAARSQIGSLWGMGPEQVVFTSGGTEANALAIHAFGQGRRVLVGATEHDAVRMASSHAEIVPVRGDGQLCLDALDRMLGSGGPALVCAMIANNETGILHPLEAIRDLCLRHGALLHVDAVQGAGRIALTCDGVTSMAVSGHKAGGAKGAGALLLGGELHVTPLMRGGGQERGRRGGTQPLQIIVGMAAAFQDACAQDWRPVADLRDRIDEFALSCGARVIGDRHAPRLPNTTSLSLWGVPAQTQLMMLDLAGFAVSTGSACSSGKVSASHVLSAMGLGEAAAQAIRISLPWNVTEEQVVAFKAAYRTMAERLGTRAA
ncbi:cysteine desulfurase family protein [Swaminathania salitolerans]|uniref:Cysteine desulfurase n=1 Tax=Swaminathania salitolerans TaxID=182838 RepID=A0A511BLY5_9PROT|nr:aminotransferase class V-fold PLP-dependent enzyme [Swaminathania salitolerans]GBQ10372.1 cysteine desulfurase [Swaminathania salitolerans LMG 21291]GEL01265.1 cysteine desulfurase [Swaminathania salitolerans]